MEKINGLDLFSGYGGISLAIRDWVRPIAYCEIERYAQGVLLSRISEGKLPSAPIWDDIRTLRIDERFPKVDIIYGGFPCQDISVAGNGKGLEGERSGLFYEVCRLVKEINPTFVFLENVPAIRTRGLREVIREFTNLGYDCRWTCVSASEVGAPHLRKRWFFLAHTNRLRGRQKQVGKSWGKNTSIFGNDGETQSVADVDRTRCTWPNAPQSTERRYNTESLRENHDRRWDNAKEWWRIEPNVGRKTYGVTSWLDGSKSENMEPIGSREEEIERGSYEILRYVQQEIVSKAIQRTIRGFNTVQAEEALLTFVREYEIGGRLPRRVLENEVTFEELLREMQYDEKAISPSLRPGQIEQFFREYPDAMNELSQLVASRSETPWDSPLWESTVERVTSGCPKRMDRIKVLGNGVVPLQVEVAFKRLIGLE